MGEAKSYAERLFDFVEIGPLPIGEAERAITVPAEEEGIDVEPEAVARIVQETSGYPYFLQEWRKSAWDVADASPDYTWPMSPNASELAVAALDESFFRLRFDRLTPTEKQYLRAMADLGPGPRRSGDIAPRLGRKVESLGAIRSGPISKGMIWSPTYGDTAFTVPLLDEFMKRIMPEFRG